MDGDYSVASQAPGPTGVGLTDTSLAKRMLEPSTMKCVILSQVSDLHQIAHSGSIPDSTGLTALQVRLKDITTLMQQQEN